MILEFNNEQLQAGMNVLEQQRVSTKSAENIAKCKQAIRYAASLIENFEYLDSVEIPDGVYENLEATKYLLKHALGEMTSVFETEKEIAVVN